MPPNPELIVGGTAAGAAITAYLSKDGIEKLLGPTAAYLGEGLKDLVAKRCEQIGRIFRAAERRLGARLEQPGAIPPRLLKSIIDDASYFSDELSAEYFGGILASSRTGEGEDDRGAKLASRVNQMSTYQIKAHYLLYASAASVFRSKSPDWASTEGRRRMKTFIPLGPYNEFIRFRNSDKDSFRTMVVHVFGGLKDEGLIAEKFSYGSGDLLLEEFPKVPGPGFLFMPSLTGMELFLWAFGHGGESFDLLFSPAFRPGIEGLPDGLPGSAACFP